MNVNYHDEIKAIAARIRSLGGAREPFLLSDPLSKAPLFDRSGSIAGSATTTLASFNSTGYNVAINGFTPGFKLTWGDKFHIQYGASSDNFSFHEIAGDYTANASGNFSNVEIFPYIPANVIAGTRIYFYKPAAKMIIYPDSFNPGSAAGLFTTGLTFKAIQKK